MIPFKKGVTFGKSDKHPLILSYKIITMNRTNIKTSWAFLVLFCVTGIGQMTAQVSRFSKNQYANGKGDTLNYRLLYPDANPLRKYPLVIFLHG